MRKKQKKSLQYHEGGSDNVILIIIKFCELLLQISLTIINALRSYLKHSNECVITYANTLKLD